MPSCSQQDLRPFKEGLDSRRGSGGQEQEGAKEGGREAGLSERSLALFIRL